MPNAETNDLSERELDILRLVATGASNKEIALKLFISSNTVKVHLRNIFTKIGVTSRTEAAMYAVRIGLVQAISEQILSEDAFSGDDNPAATNSTASLPHSVDDSGTSSHRRFPVWFAILIPIILIGMVALGLIFPPGTFIPGIFKTSTTVPIPTSTGVPRWKELAALPTARSGLAVAAFEDQIYAIGGSTVEGITGVVERYDLTTNTWTELASMPIPVTDVQAAVINGLIYVPGGRTSADSQKPTNGLEIYNPRLNQWSTGTPIPIALSGYALIAFEGRLFTFGGWDGQTYRNNVYTYDPLNDTWQERSPMPTGRAFSGAAESSGLIYIVGGYNGIEPLAVNEVYSPSHENDINSAWKTSTPLPQGRYGMGVAGVADLIYLIGGIGATNQSLQPLEYSPVSHDWQTFPIPIPESWSEMGMLLLGSNIYMMGGQVQGLYTDLHLSYQAIYTIVFPIIR